MEFVLAVIAVILAIYGVLSILHGSILFGIVILVLACIIGPGGSYGVVRRRRVP